MQEISKWFSDNGDELLRQANLTENSIVVDIGAYQGLWLKDMNSRYNCTAIGFEPMNFEPIANLSEKITIHRKALSDKDGKGMISNNSDGSTIGEGDTEIEIMDSVKFFSEDIDIDVLQINIEGYEYLLLPYLVEKKLLDRVRRIQVQFHLDKPDSHKMQSIIDDLTRIGFVQKFHYQYVWWCGERA